MGGIVRSSGRWVFAGIFLLSFLLWSRRTLLGADARKDSLALVHFRKGEEYALQGDTTRAIEEFKEAVRWNRKLSSAGLPCCFIHFPLFRDL